MLLRFGYKGPEVAAWNSALQRLGLLATSGDFFGDLTDKSTRLFQEHAGLVVDGIVGPITLAAATEHGAVATFAGELVRVAWTQVGVHEESRNRGASIAPYWAATSYPDGMANREPWCAAFMCWVVSEAMRSFASSGLTAMTRPKSAAVAGWLPWAHALPDLVEIHSPSVTPPLAGDIVIYAFPHIGIVRGYSAGTSTPLLTIEGNTNEDGSREGTSVLAKARHLGDCKAFIRFREASR